MENKIICIVLVLFNLLPMISADIIISEVDEASGIILDKELDIELRDAIVEVEFNEYGGGSLTATFNVYSNEEEKINTRVYLKAKGQECSNFGCKDVEVVRETIFNINSPYDHHTMGPEDGEFTSDFAEIYETEEGEFASVEFILKPGMNEIKIYQSIYAPFEYYLDSLSTFTKADHEKITIKGDNLNVSFNDQYPVKKISDNEWVWEYSNLDVSDENLKDVLVIKNGSSEPNPNDLVYYIIGAIVLVVVILLVVLIKRKK